MPIQLPGKHLRFNPIRMTIKWCLYLLLLLSINVLAIIKRKNLATADRILALFMTITFLEESLSFLLATKKHNNFPLFHISGPVEFLFTSLYFNYAIRFFRKRNIGIIIGSAGVVLSLFNTAYYQHTTTINSNFLLFEGTVIIIYCLLSFHQILLDETRLPYRFASFWFTICFLTYWTTTFTGWGVYALLDQQDSVIIYTFGIILAAINFIYYTGIALVFLFYKKLIPASDA